MFSLHTCVNICLYVLDTKVLCTIASCNHIFTQRHAFVKSTCLIRNKHTRNQKLCNLIEICFTKNCPWLDALWIWLLLLWGSVLFVQCEVLSHVNWELLQWSHTFKFSVYSTTAFGFKMCPLRTTFEIQITTSSRSVKCVKAQMLQRSKFHLPARQLGKH